MSENGRSLLSQELYKDSGALGQLGAGAVGVRLRVLFKMLYVSKGAFPVASYTNPKQGTRGPSNRICRIYLYVCIPFLF